jgi:hypothetical protein
MNPESGKLRHRNLPLLLLQAREHVIARFRPILNSHGITEQQWRIVRLAGVLSRMEELGYIKRKRLDHDQRRLRVSLTPRSRALATRMAPQIEATYRQIETLIGAEFSARFYRALDELIGALGAPNAAEGE